MPEESYPNTFFIRCNYIELDCHRKVKIFKIKANSFENRIDVLVKTNEINERIINFLKVRNIDPNSVFSITIQLGKLGKVMFFEWKNNKIREDQS